MFYIEDGSNVTAEMKQLLKDSVSPDKNVDAEASFKLKAALTTPLKRGVLFGDTVTNVFKMEPFDWGVPVIYPLDIVPEADVKLHIAYQVSDTGKIPHRVVAGDYLTLPTYRIATSIDWSREMAKFARWDIVSRALAVAEAGLIRKRNNDGWHTLIAAASSRGVTVNDSTATAGLFTKRLIALSQTVMRRNGGGNSTSTDRKTLTHMVVSPESLQDVRSWDATQVDEITRREIQVASGEYAMTKVFGTVLVDLDEFGVGQEYQNYFDDILGGTIPGSKNEIALGLDLVRGMQESFVMPWLKQDNGQFFEFHDDSAAMLRENRAGYYGVGRMGCGVLNNVFVILAGI